MKTKHFILYLLLMLNFHWVCAQSSSGLGIVREGVRWICIERYENLWPHNTPDPWRFYSYEFKGDTIIDGTMYKKCYWHTDTPKEHPLFHDYDTDKPVMCLREESGMVYAVIVQYRDLDFYDFLQKCEKPSNEWVLYDLNTESGRYFTEYNHDILIQGEQCKVYIDPQGLQYTLMLLVECIGADVMTDCSGDLLVPENIQLTGGVNVYYGLHHVEDNEGNVIYKGRNYHIDGSIEGDFNSDDIIDIDDLNTVINRILGPSSFDVTHDITGDGVVDIDDVNAVVNAVLAK